LLMKFANVLLDPKMPKILHHSKISKWGNNE
jgi:hypothetical protein